MYNSEPLCVDGERTQLCIIHNFSLGPTPSRLLNKASSCCVKLIMCRAARVGFEYWFQLRAEQKTKPHLFEKSTRLIADLGLLIKCSNVDGRSFRHTRVLQNVYAWPTKKDTYTANIDQRLCVYSEARSVGLRRASEYNVLSPLMRWCGSAFTLFNASTY
jgi:hypothetical protein